MGIQETRELHIQCSAFSALCAGWRPWTARFSGPASTNHVRPSIASFSRPVNTATFCSSEVFAACCPPPKYVLRLGSNAPFKSLTTEGQKIAAKALCMTLCRSHSSVYDLNGHHHFLNFIAKMLELSVLVINLCFKLGFRRACLGKHICARKHKAKKRIGERVIQSRNPRKQGRYQGPRAHMFKSLIICRAHENLRMSEGVCTKGVCTIIR